MLLQAANASMSQPAPCSAEIDRRPPVADIMDFAVQGACQAGGTRSGSKNIDLLEWVKGKSPISFGRFGAQKFAFCENLFRQSAMFFA
jgi:hypothetical protein